MDLFPNIIISYCSYRDSLDAGQYSGCRNSEIIIKAAKQHWWGVEIWNLHRIKNSLIISLKGKQDDRKLFADPKYRKKNKTYLENKLI